MFRGLLNCLLCLPSCPTLTLMSHGFFIHFVGLYLYFAFFIPFLFCHFCVSTLAEYIHTSVRTYITILRYIHTRTIYALVQSERGAFKNDNTCCYFIIIIFFYKAIKVFTDDLA